MKIYQYKNMKCVGVILYNNQCFILSILFCRQEVREQLPQKCKYIASVNITHFGR